MRRDEEREFQVFRGASPHKMSKTGVVVLEYASEGRVG
jgi:hypothetical protein